MALKIIVDAFGGDDAPLCVLRGCRMAADEYGVEILLAGSEADVKQCAAEHGISLAGMSILDAEGAIPMDAPPTDIMTSYKNCSMAVGLRALAGGDGDAMVSAGSTGALTVGGTLIVKRLRGVKRPAIGTLVPNGEDGYLLVDAGANEVCRPEMLLQFALMGSAYMERIQGRQSPRVGLINIGTEPGKGTELQQKTYTLLEGSGLNFIGNVEGKTLPTGGCDVAVADGFTGNIVLKTSEGMGKMFSALIKDMFRGFPGVLAAPLLIGGIKALRKKMDASEHGGAPLLGLRRPLIKAHGSSDAMAIKNAIRQAVACCEHGVIEQMAQAVAQAAGSGDDSGDDGE